MEYVTIIAAILFVDFLALISPGPNFVLVTSAAVSKSRRHALWTALGIATGSLCWAVAAALGIATLFEALPALGLMLKLLGVAYLLYLGAKLLRSKGLQPSAQHKDDRPQGAAGFWSGLLVNLTNPKSAAYYASVFAAFLTPDMPSWVLMVLISAIATMSLAWYELLAIGFSSKHIAVRYISISKYVDRVCGFFLVFLGLKLGLDSV